MAGSPLTEAEANLIIKSPKRINGDIRWDYDPRHDQTWAKFEKAVENEHGANLRLYASVNLVVSKSSFSLIVNGAFRVFGLDVNGSHSNKHTNGEKWKGRTHKVRWTDRCRNRFAFTPDRAIPEDTVNAFYEFCRECNISFEGQVYPVPPFQSSFDS